MACCRGKSPPAEKPASQEVRAGDNLVLTVEPVDCLAVVVQASRDRRRQAAVPAPLALPSLVEQNICLLV